MCDPSRLRLRLAVVATTLSTPIGCGDADGTTAGATESSATSAGTQDTDEPFTGRLLVTADWRNKTLSLVDFDALAAGATTRDEILVGEIALHAYEPGPLEVEVTPDGTRAVVSISPGFYDGIVGNTIGATDVPLAGTLLVVDLQARTVVAELPTVHVPMGIAIDPQGQRAYTANYGHSDAPGSTMSVIDLQALTIVEEVEIGARPEQVSLRADGALGIVNLAGDGTVVLFDPADIAGTLSAPVETSDDPSDVDFIEGTNLAVVANSLPPFTYSIIDVTDPSAPTFVADGMPPTGFPYGATPIPGTTDFIMTVANDQVGYVRADATNPASATWSVVIPGVMSFPLGVAIDAPTGLGISGAPGANVLVVLPLDGSPPRTIPWTTQLGPTYVALAPA